MKYLNFDLEEFLLLSKSLRTLKLILVDLIIELAIKNYLLSLENLG
jgi:hypothetical protein